ncbi:MAG: GNAT family N-acetyltransferase [Trueperaceae bacterium]|nr:GNAT family N-acetyltransferase [Trueperaceae bacterium]
MDASRHATATPPPNAAPVRIRAATPGDARALAALMEGIYREGRWFVGDEGPTSGLLARRLRGLDPARELMLVAEAGAAPIAWLEAGRYLPRRLAHVATLTLGVAPEWRGRGVATRLLRAALPWAQRVGVAKLRLDVRAGNSAARALYEKEGFVLEGREVGHVRTEGGYEDNLLMGRWIGGEAPADGG